MMMQRAARLVALVCLVIAAFMAGRPREVRAAYPGTNGQLIVLKGGEFWLMDPDAGNQRRYLSALFGPDYYYLRDPRWSANGGRLACVTQKVGTGPNGFAYPSAIYVDTGEGTPLRYLATVSTVLGVRPTWSPVGTKIAYGDVDGIHVIDVSTSAGTLLVANFGNVRFDQAAWSPGGGTIAMRRRETGVGPFGIESDIAIVPATGGSVVNLTRPTQVADYLGRDAGSPDWAPDGSKILFHRGEQQGAAPTNTPLETVDPVTRVVTDIVTNGDLRDAVWSPDGTQIVALEKGNGLLATLRADGSGFRFIDNHVPSAYAGPVDWRPVNGNDDIKLVVSLSAGVTNGKVFSVDVTVKNTTTRPMTNVAFTQPEGILPIAEGKISLVSGPTPRLRATLAAGASVTSTVTFAAEEEGTVDVFSAVRATDADGTEQTKYTQGIVEVGKRRLTETELQRVLGDGLTDSSQSVGSLLNAGQKRLGVITSWAAGPDGSDTIPPWLNVSITDEVVPPLGTAFAEPPGWKVSAARALGMDDRAMAWLPDAPAVALEVYLNYSHRFAMAGGKVIDDSGNAAYSGLKEAATFYGQLSSGNESYRTAASRELNGFVRDVGESSLNTIALLGEILGPASADPLGGDLRTYEQSPALQAFTKKSTEIIDAGLKAAWNKTAKLVRQAKTDPVGASGELGDIIGTTYTTVARDVALTEVGLAGVSRLGKVIEGSMPFARTGQSIDGGLAAIDPAAAALTASVDGTGEVVVRESLESLAEGTTITVEQLEALGGFYAADAEKVQKIITDINAKYNVNIEIQCRPGNPASLEFYRNGTGVPKPEWVKPKNTDWMDLALGAPPDSLGKATVFKPIRPTTETLSKYTQAQQQTIVARYDAQLELYTDATTPGGKFAKLLADSQKPEGATVSVGHGTGKRDVTGLKYSLRAVGEPGQEAFVVIDEAAGGKFVLSDADYEAVVHADTLRHLPADVRGQLELDVMNRLGKDTASFGGHAWTHSGFDLPSKYSKPFIQFVTEYTSPASARRTLEWFVGKGTAPGWLQEISTGLAVKLGRNPTSAELVDALLERFRPGNFVVKFNGTNLRVGYGAGIR